jgi:hypothetical protein
LAHGVVGSLFAPAEAIQNDQHDRPPLLHFRPLSTMTGYYGLRRKRQSAPTGVAPPNDLGRVTDDCA